MSWRTMICRNIAPLRLRRLGTVTRLQVVVLVLDDCPVPTVQQVLCTLVRQVETWMSLTLVFAAW